MPNTKPPFTPILHFEYRIWPAFAAALLVLLLLIAAVAWRQDFFTPATRFYCRTDTSAGLQENMPVKISGFRIGKVTGIQLEGVGRVRCDLAVFTRYRQLVHQDSIAVLASEGLIGQSVVVISTPTQPGPLAAPDSEIAFQRVAGIIDMAQSMKQHLEQVTDEMHTLLASLNAPDGLIHNLSSSTGQMAETMPRILQGVESIIKSVDDTMHVLQKNLADTTSLSSQLVAYVNNPEGDVKVSFRNLRESLEEVHRNTPALLEKLDHSLGAMEEATTTLRETLNRSSPDFVETVRRADDAAKGALDVIDSARKIWPISRHLPEEAPPMLLPPSLASASPPATAGH
jgi:phospholipid/cholesterol/gamma-HCH transport system substrate-binding protein